MYLFSDSDNANQDFERYIHYFIYNDTCYPDFYMERVLLHDSDNNDNTGNRIVITMISEMIITPLNYVVI